MPVDYIKAKLSPSDSTRTFFERVIVRWDSLERKEVLDSDTGELKKRTIGKYRDLTFSLYESGILIIDGSLHKYSNNGIHNYDVFSYQRLINVLNDLREVFNIDLEKVILLNIEIGLNITTQFKASKIVESILLHKQKLAKYQSINNSEFKRCIHQRYGIKMYDKTLHYLGKPYTDSKGVKQSHKIQGEIFRFEMHHNKMIALNGLGICTLNDLYDSGKLRLALELLCEQWNNLLIYDWTIRKNELTKYNRGVKLNQWSNPVYWNNLSKSHRGNQKKVMQKLMQFHSQNIKLLVMNQLKQMVQNVLQETAVKRYTDTNNNSVPINHSYILLKGTQKRSAIISTHFDIESLVLRRPRIERKAS
ncbi:hypothetical protein GCM10011344_32750 [Dokdonia pacifica]|uniref:Phage/plasmid replication protein, gene II/X family n=1 Tax=Dokdonia pacifica TaxID=1627892 RepID=A0A239BIS4_9FLAO|nr:hypothetical protein [Dokdonia pacifica]GGG29343.1 hypothetical protein GCM10011344_32750 [Dokdonia pacifica]SNS07482.1 hypothetical protein SAMN06265376_106188 [Dokdonia pacifica]